MDSPPHRCRTAVGADRLAHVTGKDERRESSDERRAMGDERREANESLEPSNEVAFDANEASEAGEDVVEAVVLGDIVLSEREHTVLRLLSEGKTTPQIAAAIYRSTDTVRWYRKRLLQKFDVHNTAALIKAASERGIL